MLRRLWTCKCKHFLGEQMLIHHGHHKRRRGQQTEIPVKFFSFWNSILIFSVRFFSWSRGRLVKRHRKDRKKNVYNWAFNSMWASRLLWLSSKTRRIKKRRWRVGGGWTKGRRTCGVKCQHFIYILVCYVCIWSGCMKNIFFFQKSRSRILFFFFFFWISNDFCRLIRLGRVHTQRVEGGGIIVGVSKIKDASHHMLHVYRYIFISNVFALLTSVFASSFK